ncbi:hypothetical protein MCUN1_000060 [Malassezia cuniculi]|uniref:Uncharacterized protein n=1 Tax=Malassezia cuniculi TaxID=948313 RepID=A0AAF0EUL0_9BASI|nr:hypothetical protein MCUN1_000060 [Malassezia cuniculi]
MKLTGSFASLLSIVLTASFAAAITTGNGWDLNGQTYDYIVIGGGTAGLTVAYRLSEDSSNTVAVIEAGDSGYDDNDKFTVPAAALYNSATNTKYDWQWKTVRQPNMNNRQASWPRGKVLGGSSAINGLYYVRQSEHQQNIWADLIGDYDTWGWGNMLAAMKKSQHFVGPRSSIQSSNHIEYNDNSHGHNGPIYTSWPGYTYPPVGAFIRSAQKVSADFNNDPYNGESHGTYMSLSTINPSSWTRSFARTGYLDGVRGRRNLHVLTGHTVTKINFDRSDSNNVRATGVVYAAGAGQDSHTVNANKEVILSGGTINNPQILQLSGIGETGLLNSLGIDVVVDLPGVGQNLQDHISAGMSFRGKSDADNGPTGLSGNARRDSYVNSAISYTSLDKLVSNTDGFVQRIKDSIDRVVENSNAPAAVKRGLRRTLTRQANELYGSNGAPVEILFNVMFGNINIQAALQHPISRGIIYITSTNPFDAPHIDPGYFNENVDLVLLREGFKLIREIVKESPLSDHIAEETSPGSSVNSNAEWENWIRQNAGTEYHPSCTCAMLPRNQGGVVGSDLKVYGTSNLRVIDASVPPLSMSAHLMSIAFGIGEIGAELILNSN